MSEKDNASNIFIFLNSQLRNCRRVLFATIPPTFAAAFMIISGFIVSILFFVIIKSNKSVFSIEAITELTL